MFLVIFTSLLGHGTVPGRNPQHQHLDLLRRVNGGVRDDHCLLQRSIAISVSFQRDAGVLKRTNGTPLPSVAFLGARILHALAR